MCINELSKDFIFWSKIIRFFKRVLRRTILAVDMTPLTFHEGKYENFSVITFKLFGSVGIRKRS